VFQRLERHTEIIVKNVKNVNAPAASVISLRSPTQVRVQPLGGVGLIERRQELHVALGRLERAVAHVLHQLPDLVFWPACDRRRQAAVVIAPGLTNPRRERAALECWQRSIEAGQYAQVHYVVSPAFVSHLSGVAEAIGAAPQLIVGERVIADKLPVLSSVIENVCEESVA
jgi:hypothetical protein